MHKLLVTVLLAGLLSASTPVALGDSLWSDGSRPLITNERLFRVGDLLTITILEQSSASNLVSTDGSEKSTFLMGPGAGKLRRLVPYMKGNVENDYQGSGKTSRSGTMTARLTVTVCGIDANGILNVEGRRKIVVNKDEQEIYVKGRVRPQDVLPDNSVLSSYIADAYIEYKGTGSGQSGQPGIISRILSWLF